MREGFRLIKHEFPLCKSMLMTSSHHVFHVFGTVFQDCLLYHLVRDWGKTGLDPLPCPFSKTGVTFSFSQSSGTFPEHYDFPKIVESGLTVTLANSISTHRCILSDPTDFCMSSLFKCSLTWSFPTKGKSSLFQTFSGLGLGWPGFLKANLPAKTKA